MPSKILTLNASPVISPSEDYLNKVQNGATLNQYEKLTEKIVKPAVRGAFQALSRDVNTKPIYTELLGRAISVLTFGNSANISDPISALMIPLNRALYAANKGEEFLNTKNTNEKADIEQSAAFAKKLIPKLTELGKILGFTLTENTSTGQFLFINKNQNTSPILDNTGSPINKENLIVRPLESSPIYLFNTDEKFALNDKEKILEQFDKLIVEIGKAAENPQEDATIKGVREEGKGLKPRDSWLADRITQVGPSDNTLSLSHVPIKQIRSQAAYIANTKGYCQDVGPDTPFDEVLANVTKVSVMGSAEHIPDLNKEYVESRMSFGVNPEDGYLCYRCQSDGAAKNLAQ
jgi:hypothetical protein